MTMVMCDRETCRFNNDRVCARAKVYCVGRRYMSAKRYGVIDLMRKPKLDAERAGQKFKEGTLKGVLFDCR